MAKINQLQATARPNGGKGAARAERRAGRVPAVIYGDNQAPVGITLPAKELTLTIHAGRFLSTVCDIEVDGKKHRAIPRDYQLHPVNDSVMHVDFLRLGEGAKVRVSIPVHILGAESAPGVKRGGAVNIVTHAIEVECSADAIPQSIDVDVSGLDMNHSKHLSDIELPKGVRVLAHGDITLVTIVPPSGYAEEIKAAADAVAATAAAAAAATAAAASAPKGAPGADTDKK
jgi:large subunit ribosomal protein L25